MRDGAGRERRRGRRRRRAGGGVQGRSPQPPQRGRAVPGRGHGRRRHPARRVRGRRAADRRARLAALRRARLGRARATCSSTSSAASATTATRSAWPPWAARSTSRPPTSRTAWSTRCASGMAPRERLMRSAAAGVGNLARAARRASPGATASAARRVLATAELGDEDDVASARACRSAIRSRRTKLHRVLPRAARGGAAARRSRTSAPRGSSSSSSEMASKGEVGLDIDVARVPLREADMEPFEIMISESQERMLCVVEPERLDDVLALCARWEVRATRDRRGHRQRAACACFDGDELVGDMPGRGARRRLPALRPRAGAPAGGRSTRRRQRRTRRRRRRRAETLLALLALAEHRQQALGLRAVRLDRRLAHGAPARGRPTRRCCRWRTTAAAGARSRCRSTATAGGWPATRTGARSRRCSSAPPTSPASARSRSASPTASTSATPRSRTSPGSSSGRCRGWRDACRALGVPVVGGNVSLYNEGATGRSTRRRSSAWSASCPTRSDGSGCSAFARGGPTRSRCSARSRPSLRRLGAGEAARRAWPTGCPRRTSSCCARRLELRARRRSRGGGLTLGPRHLRGRPRLRARRVLHRRRDRRAGRPRSAARAARRREPASTTRCSARGPAACVVSGPREAIEGWPRRRVRDGLIRLGEVGGESLALTAGVATLNVPVGEARTAYEGGLPGRFS